MMVNHEPSLSLIATTLSLIIAGVLLLTSYILSLTETPFSGLLEVRPGHLAVRQSSIVRASRSPRRPWRSSS